MRPSKIQMIVPILALALVVGCAGSGPSALYSSSDSGTDGIDSVDKGSAPDSETPGKNPPDSDPGYSGTDPPSCCCGKTSFSMSAAEEAIYDLAAIFTPVVVSGISEEEINGNDTGWGDPRYEISNLFQYYSFPEHEGIIDTSNIYKLLFEITNHLSQGLCKLSKLDAPTVIAPLFDFDNEPRTYTHVTDRYAFGRDGNAVNILINWIWDESPKMSYAAVEAIVNLKAGQATFDYAYLVDYAGDSDYSLRTHFEVDILANSFTIVTLKNGTTDDAFAISMVGTGEYTNSIDDYYLLKITDNETLSDYPLGRYYSFSYSAAYEDIMNYGEAGYPPEGVHDPDDYAEELDEWDFFSLDGSDNAQSLEDFANTDFILEY